MYAIRLGGTVVTLAVPGLPHGGDIGVENAGFVPPRFGAGDAPYLADRYSKGTSTRIPTAPCAYPART